jgi:chorismate-pyruvate lyase
VLARRYHIIIGAEPTFEICEWFLPAVAAAMQRATVRSVPNDHPSH